MITVMVPTFDRPEGVTRAVRSLFEQTLAETGFTIIIVDNTPDATAATAIAELRHACPPSIKLVTLHEPRPGVANARNTAMASVDGDLVAFLDDDQSAPETWLESLLEAYESCPAAVTFGPVVTVLPEGITKHKAYFRAFFAREPDFASGYIDTYFGCGNALVDFSQIPGSAPWFDTKMNEMGGEDDLLFARARESGGRFAWAGDAPVNEHPAPDRVTLNYTLKRAFAFGQSPVTLAIKGTPKRYERVPLWMAIGAGKMLWHGLQWAGLALIGHDNRATQLDLAIRGFSKIVWWVDLKFYGASALKASEPSLTERTETHGPIAAKSA